MSTFKFGQKLRKYRIMNPLSIFRLARIDATLPTRTTRSLIVAFTLVLLLVQPSASTVEAPTSAPLAKYVILMIADGWGIKQIEAANAYINTTPTYQSWTQHWISTYPAGGRYNPVGAWANFDYVKGGTTDSAAAATALYAGVKTADGKISVSTSNQRLFTTADKARVLKKAVGAVTSVYISHATPGAWYAHNDARSNGYAIADEGLFGDPNTTGTPANDSRYGGGHGPTLPPVDILIGAGHPGWQGGSYVNTSIYNKLVAENGQPGSFAFVERIAGAIDGGPRLLSVANDPTVTRLAGLFGGTNGNLDFRLADGSGYNPENPTLVEITQAALAVLNRNPKGFVLMIEGGAIDWGGHNNNMNQMIGEMIDFNNAVQAVINWVENPANGSSWANTLVIVTGDHETGYLTAGPDVFPDQPLGEVSARTLVAEKQIANTGRRASWADTNGNNKIEVGETVYWAWNSGEHTNSLIPLYSKGVGSDLFATYATGSDPVRGAYLDNTDVFRVTDAVLLENLPPVATFTATPAQGETPLTVHFDATASSAPDDTIVSYTWDFGDGGRGLGIVTSHTYTLIGTYTPVLTVTDSFSATDSVTATVTVFAVDLKKIYLPVIITE